MKRNLYSPGENRKKTKTNMVCSTIIEPGDYVFQVRDVDNYMSQLLPKGMSTADFITQFWDKGCALLVKGRKNNFFENVITELHDLNLGLLLSETPSPTTYIWLPKENGIIQQIGVESPDVAEKMYILGSSLYFRGPQELTDHMIKTFFKDFEIGIGSTFPDTGDVRGELEVFFTRKWHVTEWHTDKQDNITFQLRGTKTWELRNGPLYPAADATPFNRNFSADDLGVQLKLHKAEQHDGFKIDDDRVADEIVTLEPGDFMYFPKGMWHRVSCETDHAVSLNISMSPLSFQEFLSTTVRGLCSVQPSTRSCLTGAGLGYAEALVRAETALCDLRNMLNSSSARDFLPPASMHPGSQSQEFFISSEGKITPEIPTWTLDFIPQIEPKTRLRKNPLSVILSNEEIATVMRKRREDPQSGIVHSKESTEAEDEGQQSDIGSEEEEDDTLFFSVHFQFAGPSFASMMKQSLEVVRNSSQAKIVDYVMRLNQGITEDVEGLCLSAGVKQEEVYPLLGLFIYLGVLTVDKQS